MSPKWRIFLNPAHQENEESWRHEDWTLVFSGHVPVDKAYVTPWEGLPVPIHFSGDVHRYVSPAWSPRVLAEVCLPSADTEAKVVITGV